MPHVEQACTDISESPLGATYPRREALPRQEQCRYGQAGLSRALLDSIGGIAAIGLHYEAQDGLRTRTVVKSGESLTLEAKSRHKHIDPVWILRPGYVALPPSECSLYRHRRCYRQTANGVAAVSGWIKLITVSRARGVTRYGRLPCKSSV